MAMAFAVNIPFVEHLNFELIEFEGGRARIDCGLQPHLMNSFGVAHGGLTMTLLDVVMAHAARSPDTQGGALRPGVVTIEMKTSFTRPGQGRMIGTARVLHRSTSLVFCEGSVHDVEGALLAHATGTFKHIRALPVSGKLVHAINGSD